MKKLSKKELLEMVKKAKKVDAYDDCTGCIFNDPQNPNKNCFHPKHYTMSPTGCVTLNGTYIFIIE